MTDSQQKNKRVRLLEKGVYTIEPKSVRSRNDHLCQVCSIISNCPIQRALSFTEGHAEAVIRTCARFVPSIPFCSPYVGLHFSIFNTLRAGTTWQERLVKGKVVALTDSKSGDIIRFGKVKSVISGGIDKMLEVHAQFNHIAMAGKGVDEVERVIRKSYGHFLKPDSKLTAIYIENVSHELIDKIDKKLGDTPENVESKVINLSWHRNL
ncbi:hypothetical protein [Xenorhabdus szentirmaii]|uniref:Uncharacterized protein n=1 Tax=Xenorhabdus szentirmaii DSM 16338 TaxID=1427518 RepID=W1IRE3_9GAMM|nr:hypothetical protein [Xenorhabdus szentirmaii]PHM30578.1 hypothetical protein Xsze_04169 [Xenorhabdus szentirmaii DSM 16338]CDL81047.1 conserved hypothetical protein [Xenorhabdus szentirmaii DSM 16338]